MSPCSLLYCFHVMTHLPMLQLSHYDTCLHATAFTLWHISSCWSPPAVLPSSPLQSCPLQCPQARCRKVGLYPPCCLPGNCGAETRKMPGNKYEYKYYSLYHVHKRKHLPTTLINHRSWWPHNRYIYIIMSQIS